MRERAREVNSSSPERPVRFTVRGPDGPLYVWAATRAQAERIAGEEGS